MFPLVVLYQHFQQIVGQRLDAISPMPRKRALATTDSHALIATVSLNRGLRRSASAQRLVGEADVTGDIGFACESEGGHF